MLYKLTQQVGDNVYANSWPALLSRMYPVGNFLLSELSPPQTMEHRRDGAA